MWYTKNDSGKITLNKIYHFDFNEYQFIETNALTYAPYFSDINKELERKYKKLLSPGEWMEINILSEMPRGVGLWFWSLLALLLSATMNRALEKIDSENLETIRKQNIYERIHDRYGTFHHIFSDALHFDKFLYGMVSSWIKIASFFDAQYPIISFSEDFDKSLLDENTVIHRCYGFRLNELFKDLRETPYVPIDYGIVYSGKPVLLEQISGDNYRRNKEIAKAIRTDFKKMFGHTLDNISPNRRPKFYKNLVDAEHDAFDITYGNLMGIISLKILYFMSKLYSEAYDENHMLQFLEAVKKMRQGDEVTRESSPNFLKFIKSFLESFEGPQQYISLSPNDSTVMGGSLTFAMPLEWFRKMMMDSIEKIKVKFPGSKLIYANRIDGNEIEWLKCEQNIKTGFYSEFIDSSSCILKMADGRSMIGDCEEYIQNYKQGLLLDILNNKMYLNGRKLTSDDLHSQSATIEILKTLIDNIGKDVANKQLPHSSYAKNKNEMLWKIILPLIELIEKETGKKLPLICKWSIYEFYTKLNKSDIDIAIIDKIGHK